MTKPVEIMWLVDAEEHDYPAAASYLTLIAGDDEVEKVVAMLMGAQVVQFKAKDVFRASNLSLLGVSNSHVKKDSDKILAGKKLSPLLLVRSARDGKVIIADGYHRLCAVYGFDEDALIHCKIV